MSHNAGTAYIKIDYEADSVKNMTTRLADDLRRLADYIDAYDPAAEQEGDNGE
jgi:hypothetical protein